MSELGEGNGGNGGAEKTISFKYSHWFKEPIFIPFLRIEIITVIGNIILSLRHPSNSGPSIEYARSALRKLIAPMRDDPEVQAAVKEEWREFFESM